MPIKSQAQRRWLYWAEANKKVPPGTAEQWEKETPKDKKLPERLHKKAFWLGFGKHAEGALTGGAGHSGTGEGSVDRNRESPERDGTLQSHGGEDASPKTDKTLLDRDRNPRSFDPFKLETEYD